MLEISLIVDCCHLFCSMHASMLPKRTSRRLRGYPPESQERGEVGSANRGRLRLPGNFAWVDYGKCLVPPILTKFSDTIFKYHVYVATFLTGKASESLSFYKVLLVPQALRKLTSKFLVGQSDSNFSYSYNPSMCLYHTLMTATSGFFTDVHFKELLTWATFVKKNSQLWNRRHHQHAQAYTCLCAHHLCMPIGIIMLSSSHSPPWWGFPTKLGRHEWRYLCN